MSVKNKYKNTELFIQSCEEKFSAQLDTIVEKIMNNCSVKIITLAGPTCSGKTTAANMIIKRLDSFGKKTHLVSIDDFFYDREKILQISKDKGLEIPALETPLWVLSWVPKCS